MRDSNCCITLHFIVFLLISVLIAALLGCNSLPPSEPADQSKDLYFDPRNLEWEQVATPPSLASYWYKDGSPSWWGAGVTLRLGQYTSSQWSTETATVGSFGDIYRIVYQFESYYYAFYFDLIGTDSLRYMFSDRPASSRAAIDTIPASTTWQVLTNFITWNKQGGILPPDLIGKWAEIGGLLDIEIENRQVLINGQFWSLDSLQDNGSASRMVLSGNDSSMVLYYSLVNDMEARFLGWNAADNLCNKNGFVEGPWVDCQKYTDFLELAGWHDGVSFSYEYGYSTNHRYVTQQSVPRDSIWSRRYMKGKMNLSINGAIYGNGQGEINLGVQFDLEYIRGYDITNHIEMIQDSLLIGQADSIHYEQGATIAERSYSIYMANDTLWIDQPDGKIYFAERKTGVHTRINLLPFIYPSNPQLGYFLDPAGLDAKLIMPGHDTDPWLQPLILPLETGGQVIPGEYGNLIYGLICSSHACADQTDGLTQLMYALVKSDTRWWQYGGTFDSGPYTIGTNIHCILE